MKRSDRRSDCPVNHALEVFGDSWSLLIIRDLMFRGKRTYSEFAASPERISSNVLASRLKHLVATGVVAREGAGPSTRYGLTPKGLDLLPVLLEMIAWSGDHDPETAAPLEFLERLRTDKTGVLRDVRGRIAAEHGLSD